MQILSNGQVQITNKKTGEVKVVNPEELSSISPILANNYARALTQRKAANEGKGTPPSDPLKYLVNPADIPVNTPGAGAVSTPKTTGDPFALDSATDFYSKMGITDSPLYVGGNSGQTFVDPADEEAKKRRSRETFGNLNIDFSKLSVGDGGFTLNPQNGGLSTPAPIQYKSNPNIRL